MTVNPNEILRSRNFAKAKLFQRVMIFKNSLCSLKKSIMNKRATIIALGLLVALMPFLGFPGGAKTIFFVFVGLLLAVIGYVLETECEKCTVGKKNEEEEDRKQDDQEIETTDSNT
jgi:flagellar biosynthesis component FlhA